MFIVAGVRLCHAAGGLTLTATIILTDMGSPTLCFRVTTFVFGHFYQ